MHESAAKSCKTSDRHRAADVNARTLRKKSRKRHKTERKKVKAKSEKNENEKVKKSVTPKLHIMKKIVLSTIMLFLGIIVTNAQDWTVVDEYQYPGQHVVLVGLVDADGINLTFDTDEDDIPKLGAFIGDECRGSARLNKLSSNDGQVINYFQMYIRGEEADNGKPITFRLYLRGIEYELSVPEGNDELTYDNDAKANLPITESLFKLQFVEPTGYTFPNELTVNVGETLDLLPLIEFVPEGANVPSNIFWDFDNSQQYIKVENNVLSGLEPARSASLILGIGKLVDSDEQGWAYVYVRQPITSLTLKEEYTEEQVVYIHDADALTAIMSNCYEIEPADANEDLVWSWDVEDDFTENNTEDTDGNPYTEWTPNTAGHHKLVLKGGEHDITLSVYVMNYLESINPKVKEIHLFVGDNLSNLLPYAYEFTPNEFINRNVTFEVIRDSEGVLSTDEAGTITAAKVGTASLQIKAEGKNEDGNTVSNYIFIEVHPNVTDVNVKSENLAFEYTDQEIDITEQLFANFQFTPDATYEPVEGEVTSDNQEVCEVTYSQNSGAWTAKALALGSATIVISHSAQRTTLVNGALNTSTVIASSKFRVTVTQGLLGFNCDDVVMGRNQVRTIALTPNPATASFDPSKIEVKVIVNENFTYWDLAQAAASDGTGLNWTINPEAIGEGSIKVYYDKEEFGSAAISIYQSFEQKGGWAWVSPYQYNLDRDDIQALYGDALHEIRSQHSVLFNDPVYGYFGDLWSMQYAKCYKVYIKDDEYVNNYIETDIQYTAEDKTYCFLHWNWTWFGNPYQFDHAINEVMPLVAESYELIEYLEGDRIVSKDGGFAVYDGTEWTGSLTTFKAGEGYLIYLEKDDIQGGFQFPAETELGKPASQPSNAHALKKHANVWDYNAAQFSDNMSMIADLGEEFADDRYSIGAYINGECRGEGVCVNGKWFITIHGDAASNGQAINFRVYDTMNGKTYDVDTTQPYSQMAGSLKAPISLKVAGSSTGIESISADSLNPNAKYYTIDGIEVTNPTTGLYIVVDGNKAQKVYVK